MKRNVPTFWKRWYASFLLAVLGVAVLSPGWLSAASAPNVITYQGRLLNANGVPVASASASVLFELYDTSVAGTCVWSNSSSTCATAVARTVSLTDGLFSEPLGDTTLGVPYAAIPDSVFGDNAALYLQVTVNGEALTPRKQMTAAPYALNADTLDGLESVVSGSTVSALAAFDANGALVVTGNPGGSGVSQGSLYVNPASIDTAANDTLFGIADGGTERLRVDKEGDVFLGGSLTFSGVATDITTASGEALTLYPGGTGDTVLSTDDDTFVSVLPSVAASSVSASFFTVAMNVASGAGTQFRGQLIQMSTSADADSYLGLVINPVTATAGTLTGLAFGNITGGAGDERAIRLGTGYDNDIVFDDLSPDIMLADGGVLTFEDNSSNSLLSLTDAGTTGNLAVTGDLAVEGGDITNTAGGLRFTPGGGGNVVARVDGDSNFQVEATAAPGTSMLRVSNETFGTTASIDGIVVTFEAASDGNPGSLNNALNIVGSVASGDVGDFYRGIHIQPITGTASSEVALRIEDGWDQEISFGGTSPVIEFFNGGTLSFQANGGSVMMTLFDTGTEGNLTVTGDFFADDATLIPNADTGSTVNDTLGGAVHVANTGNDDYGLTVYSDNASSNNALAYLFADNAGFDDTLLELRNDSTTTGSHGAYILQNNITNTTGSALGTHALIIDTNEVGSNQELFVMRSDIAGTADIEFRFESDGDAFADGTWTGGGADFAEYFRTSDVGLTDYVAACQDTALPNGVKRCEAGDTNIMGVVSTNPGFVGNNQERFKDAGTAGYALIGLVGQVESNATAADGAIQIGDPLTASSVTGGSLGKAYGPTRIVGYALESMTTGSGRIKVYVHPTWYAGDILRRDGSSMVVGADMALAPAAQANAANPAVDSNSLTFRGAAWTGSSAVTVGMGIANKVTTAGLYRLAVTNTLGAEVASFSQAGDMILSGKLYPSDNGVRQEDAYIFYDSTGPGYMKTNAAGWNVGSYDFAEMFASQDALQAGEVVVFGASPESVARSSGETYDGKIAGIVSTRPGFLAGEYKDGQYPVALAGRVPTLVTNENGAIEIGDPLTTSSRPGYAMRATQSGQIIGYAMEAFSGAEGKIVTFVRASYADARRNVAPAADDAASGVSMSDVETLNVTGTLSMNGGRILSVGMLEGLANTWKLEENGDFRTRGRLVQIIRSHQGEDVETYASMTRESTIQMSGTAILQNGSANIMFDQIDPLFNDVISAELPYRVLVTPAGATGQLSVFERNTQGFSIRDTAGSSGVAVDWLVIAYQKDARPFAPVNDAPTSETVESEDEGIVDEVLNEQPVDEVEDAPVTVGEEISEPEEIVEEETVIEPVTEETILPEEIVTP